MIITQYRLLTVFALTVGAAIVLFSENTPRESSIENQSLNNTSSDAHIKGATIIQYNENGIPITLQSTESQLLKTGNIIIDNPYITFKPDSQTKIIAQAKNGTLRNINESLELKNDVVITRISRDEQNITIKSNILYLDSANQQLETDEHVWISDGNSTLEATGLSASLKNRELYLKSNVRGTYVIE